MANTYSSLANNYVAHHELESVLIIIIGAALHMVEATCGVRGKSDVTIAYLDCHPNILQQHFQYSALLVISIAMTTCSRGMCRANQFWPLHLQLDTLGWEDTCQRP